jgi:hypothetical protein
MKLPIALRTVAALPFRAVGIRQSRMNPNTCTICETMFERVMKARQIEIARASCSPILEATRAFRSRSRAARSRRF